METETQTVSQPLADILERISDGFVAFDAQMNYTYVNARGGELLGRRPADLIGKNYWQEYPEAQGTSFANAYTRALETQTPITLDDYYAPWDRWFENRIYPSPEGLSVFFTDVTERKRAEQMVQRDGQILRLFVEHSPAAIAMFDREMRYIVASYRFCTDYELGEQDIVGRSHYEVFPEIPERWKDIHRRCLAGATEHAEEDPFPRKDGRQDWVRWEICPWYETEGEIGGIILFSEVITERKQARQEIHMLNTRLQVLISAIQELAAARDMEAVMAAVRTHARQLTDSDGVAFVLREDDQCYYADEDAIAPLWKGQRFPMTACISGWVMLNRQPAVIEDIYEDPRVPIDAYRPTFVKSLVVAPIRTHQPLGAIGNYWAQQHKPTDTEVQLVQTLADAAARAMENVRLLEELEQRVAKRTAQLEAINRELETFTYSVSHDLKAPLRGIDGYSRLLLTDYADKLDDEGRTFLHTIRQAAVQMNQLIEDLLDYSRLERRSLKRGPVNLPALVEALLRECAGEIRAGNVTVAANVGCADITTDPDGLALILRNLLDNALKFSRNVAAPAIEIGGRETGTSCILWVRDNGIGFDMKFHDRIFEIFQRLHRAEEYPGTGIGLTIVNKAVSRLGGRVWAESAPGQGATFYVELPQRSGANPF